MSTKLQYIERNLQADLVTLLTDQRNTEQKVQSFINKVFVNVIENNIRWSFINDLYNGLNDKAVNKSALKAWIHRYSPLRWDNDTSSFVKKNKSKWDKELINQGQNNPWYNYVPKERKEVAPKQWDKTKNFSSLKKQTEKLLALANSANDEESIKLLKAIIASL